MIQEVDSYTHTNPSRLSTRGIHGIKQRKFSLRARQRVNKWTHLTSWLARGNRLFDETQLGRRHAPDEEDEEQRVVAGVRSGHLMGGQDVMIGQCVGNQWISPVSAGDQVIRNVTGRLIVLSPGVALNKVGPFPGKQLFVHPRLLA